MLYFQVVSDCTEVKSNYFIINVGKKPCDATVYVKLKNHSNVSAIFVLFYTIIFNFVDYNRNSYATSQKSPREVQW